MPPSYGHYCIEAGRKDGAWRLRILPWTGRHEEDMTARPCST
jgi:hypothetical protein